MFSSVNKYKLFDKKTSLKPVIRTFHYLAISHYVLPFGIVHMLIEKIMRERLNQIESEQDLMDLIDNVAKSTNRNRDEEETDQFIV